MTKSTTRSMPLVFRIRRVLMVVAALLPVAAVAQITPKAVLQTGHGNPAGAVAWLPDARFVLTASTSEAIIWNTETGVQLDFIRLPQPAVDERIEIDAARADGNIATLYARVVDNDPIAATRSAVCRRYRLDLTTRAMTALPDVAMADHRDAQPADCAPPFAPDPLARGRSVTFVRDAIILNRVGAPPLPLRNIALRRYDRAYVAPDGQLIAHLGHRYRDTADSLIVSRFEVRSTVTGELYPPVDAPGSYARLFWLGGDHYAAIPAMEQGDECAADSRTPALIVDGGSGEIVERLGALRAMAPVGGSGAMIGIRAADCARPDAGDSLWMRPAGGAWRKLDVPAIAGREILKLGVAPSGGAVAVATVPPGDDLADKVVTLIKGDLLGTTLPQSQQLDAPIDHRFPFTGLGIARDDSRIMAIFNDQVRVWDTGDGHHIGDITIDTTTPTFFSGDATTLIVGDEHLPEIHAYGIADGRLAATIPAGSFIDGGVLPGRGTLWTAAKDGAIRIYRTRDWKRLLTMFRLPGDGFLTVGADGRYDTNLWPDTKELRWLMADQPWRSLAPQTFMRDYYRPQLMARTLACIAADNCDTALPPPPPVADLNRVLPEVAQLTVRPGATGFAEVTITVRNGVEGGQASSGVYDLRLFRDGKLVAEWPDPGHGKVVPLPVDGWRTATRVMAAGQPGTVEVQARIALATGAAPVAFTAYAFNSDRVKGETLATLYRPARPVPARRRRAVIVAIGVNDATLPRWHLNFAASDAQAVAKALSVVPDRHVTTITLTSIGTSSTAQKAVVRAVLLALGGQAGTEERRVLTAAGIAAAKVRKVTPDDFVLLAFSGHGDTIGEEFYLLPSDGRALADGRPDPSTLISSAELTAWLRPVDAGEMAIVIDACHSAAATAAGDYRPGPMGDPGLGQLAFDKGIRILAATQADNVALEDSALGHGLLTHVLVDDGLASRGAAAADGAVRLAPWLRYGVTRLPEATQHGRQASRSMVALDNAPVAKTRPAQQPSLFDFNRDAATAMLATAPK